MIYGDVREDKRVHEAFTKRLGTGYAIKELGCWDCSLQKIPVINSDKTYCALPDELDILLDSGFSYNQTKDKCFECPNKDYVLFADFEIAEGRAFYERKTVADFVASRKSRLYLQLNALDMFVEDGRKGLILEGMPRHVKLQDSKGFFSGFDKKVHDLRGLSPLEQAIEIGDHKEWTYSFIREILWGFYWTNPPRLIIYSLLFLPLRLDCKMRGIEFVQTWDLEETVEFLIQCDAGYDQEPKLRILPKRYPEIPVEQNILCLIKGIGKETSEKLLEQYGTLSKLITALRKISESKAKEHKSIYELWKVFH